MKTGDLVKVDTWVAKGSGSGETTMKIGIVLKIQNSNYISNRSAYVFLGDCTMLIDLNNLKVIK